MILVESWAALVYDPCIPNTILVAVGYWATTYKCAVAKYFTPHACHIGIRIIPHVAISIVMKRSLYTFCRTFILKMGPK